MEQKIEKVRKGDGEMKYYNVEDGRYLVRQNGYWMPEIWWEGDNWEYDTARAVNLFTEGREITLAQAEALKKKIAAA